MALGKRGHVIIDKLEPEFLETCHFLCCKIVAHVVPVFGELWVSADTAIAIKSFKHNASLVVLCVHAADLATHTVNESVFLCLCFLPANVSRSSHKVDVVDQFLFA